MNKENQNEDGFLSDPLYEELVREIMGLKDFQKMMKKQATVKSEHVEHLVRKVIGHAMQEHTRLQLIESVRTHINKYSKKMFKDGKQSS